MNESRQDFWEGLNETIAQRPNTPLRATARADSENDSWRPQRHLADSVGYSFNLPLRKGEIQVYLIADRNRDREAVFDRLREYQDPITDAFDGDLEWRPDDGRYKLLVRRDAEIESETGLWDDYQRWLIDRAERLYFATAPHLRGIDPK